MTETPHVNSHEASQNAATESLSVLLVDDEPWLREELATGLDLRGVRVRTAADAREAMALLRDDPDIGVLMTDVRMPGISGLELMREALAARPPELAIAAVIMTGHGDIAMATEAMRGGAIDFLGKPFTVQEALDAASRGLERARTLREAARAAERQRQALATAEAEAAMLGTRLAEALSRLVQPKDAGPDEESLHRARLLAHELRTPLVPVLGFSELLQQESLPPQLVQDYGGEIAQGARRLMTTIDKLLAFDLLAAPGTAPTAEAVDPATLVAQAMAEVRPLAERQRVTLHPSVPNGAPLTCRAQLLVRALVELVENAVLASSEGGTVEIAVERGPGLAFRVRDSGPGCDPAVLADPGRPFTSVEPLLVRKRQGLGLGLAIARRVAEMQGGTLALRRRPEGGTEASLVLPG